MTTLKFKKSQFIAAAVLVIVSAHIARGGEPVITTGLSVMINGKGPFSYMMGSAAKQFEQRGYIVGGSTQNDVYSFTIPRTAKTGLDKLGWKTTTPCATHPEPKEGAVAGVVNVSTRGIITFKAG